MPYAIELQLPYWFSMKLMNTHDPLGTGYFSVSEAARLLQVRQAKMRGWIDGYPNTQVGPLIHSNVEERHGIRALSFVNLMEARFVDAFVHLGLHVLTIRALLDQAREFVEHPHPFATNIVFRTDGRNIFAKVATATGDKQLFDLRKKNWAFSEVLDPLLKGEVVYDESGFARRWQPRPKRTPNVVVDPRIAFGRPIIQNALVPTRDLLDAFIAEGDRPVDEAYANVAAWYQIDVARVREAVDFEHSLVPLKKAA